MSERKVTTDALETLGTIIDANQKRDAIHLAVEPVIAGELMLPGARITVRGGVAYLDETNPLGIVDPFLPMRVLPKGARFWFVMMPRMVTSLRHVWSHPMFKDELTVAEAPMTNKEASEQWMRAWATRHMSTDYYGDNDKLPADRAYDNAIKAGHTMHAGPYENINDVIDNTWWDHWENITGVRGTRGSYFSCAC